MSKDPAKVRAGAIGARKRWGAFPRVARLDALDPEERAIVLAYLDLAKRRRESGAVGAAEEPPPPEPAGG